MMDVCPHHVDCERRIKKVEDAIEMIVPEVVRLQTTIKIWGAILATISASGVLGAILVAIFK